MKIKLTSQMLMVAGFLLFLLPLVSAEIPPLQYDGDKVFIDTPQAYISAEPSMVFGSEPVVIEWTSKQYTGNINIVFGYNGDYVQPYSLERYNGTSYQYSVLNRENDGSYEFADNQTTFTHTNEWDRVALPNNFIKRNVNFNGKTTFYVIPNVQVNAGQTYKYRIKMSTPYVPLGVNPLDAYPDYDGKYDIAFYPSSWGDNIVGAYQNNQLFVLDPDVALTTGLEHYWSFDNWNGTHVSDDWGGLNGTNLDGNPPINVAGKVGTNATDYEGDSTDANIVFADQSSLQIGAGENFSLSFWINENVQATNDRIIAYKDGDHFQNDPDAGGWTIRMSDGGDVKDLRINFMDTAGYTTLDVNTNFNTGTWYHLVMTLNRGNNSVAFYKNGAFLSAHDLSSETGVLYGSTNRLTLGAIFNNGASSTSAHADVNLDEVAFYKNRILTIDDVQTLYNGSAGYNPITYSIATDYFLVKAYNGYNGSEINKFNATINGTFYQTTNGTIITSIDTATALNVPINISIDNYFPQNVEKNVSTDANLTMIQADVYFACYQAITSSLLSCDEAGRFIYNAGTYNITANVTGHYSVTQEKTINALDNKTINFTGFDNAWLYINANNITGGNAIENFTINYTELNTGWSEQLTAVGLNINNTLVAGLNYTITFIKDGYETTSENFTNFSNQQYNFKVYDANSINITIRLESDSSIITEPITIRFADENSTIKNYETSTGYKYINGLSPANYTITFLSTNFSTRQTNLVFNNDHKDLTMYLIPADSSNTIYTFQDRDDGSRIAGVVLSVQKLINTSWVVVDTLLSDITGRTSFDYTQDVAYRFVSTIDNYKDKNWTLDPILFDSYVIKLDKDYNLQDNSDFNGVLVYFSPKTFVENTSTRINFTFGNPVGEFVNYGFNATWNGTYVSDSGNTGIGSNLNATLEIINSDVNDRVTITFYYELDNGETYSFVRTYTIQEASSNGNFRDLGGGYGLGLLERILLVVFMALLVAGAGAYFGGAVAGGVMAMVVFGLFSYTGFISWWLTLPSLIIMFIVATWRSST